LGHKKTDNQTEKSKNGAEDLNDENLDEPVKEEQCKRVFSVLDTTGHTYKLGSAASAKAAPLPLIPTEIPQIRLHIPTVIPPQKTAYPV
jgi:hypothetical protein